MTPRQLLASLSLIVALMAAGAVAGRVAAPSLARANYVVLVADHYVREKGAAAESPQESLQTRAIRVLGLTPDVLIEQARATQAQFRIGAPIFGAWCGLAAGLTVAASLRRKRRIEYDTHPARCQACARCFEVCPVEHKYRGAFGPQAAVRPIAAGERK
jgi:ferredoxin